MRLASVAAVERADVIVVGAGAMGSATAWWLARRGVDVVVIERFAQGHARGSSHGGSRVFRFAYDEPDYVRLAMAARPLWDELADESGEEIVLPVGGIDTGEPSMVQATRDALDACGAASQWLSPDDVAERFRGLHVDGPALFSPDYAVLRAATAVRALQDAAERHGAALRFDDPVRQIEVDAADGAVVHADHGSVTAPVVVVTAGAWAGELLDGVVAMPPLTVTQEQWFHFAARDGFADAHWPVFVEHAAEVDRSIFSLPTPGEGIKVAEHHAGVVTTGDDRDFVVRDDGRDRVQAWAQRHLPGVEVGVTSEATCLYTNTPSHDFVVDRRGPVVVGSPCSGHGFKFTPELGRMLAALALDDAAPLPRFALPA